MELQKVYKGTNIRMSKLIGFPGTKSTSLPDHWGKGAIYNTSKPKVPGTTMSQITFHILYNKIRSMASL